MLVSQVERAITEAGIEALEEACTNLHVDLIDARLAHEIQRQALEEKIASANRQRDIAFGIVLLAVLFELVTRL